MKKVVDVIGEFENRKHDEFFKQNIFLRLIKCCHFSSANFDNAKKADLDGKLNNF